MINRGDTEEEGIGERYIHSARSAHHHVSLPAEQCQSILAAPPVIPPDLPSAVSSSSISSTVVQISTQNPEEALFTDPVLGVIPRLERHGRGRARVCEPVVLAARDDDRLAGRDGHVVAVETE